MTAFTHFLKTMYVMLKDTSVRSYVFEALADVAVKISLRVSIPGLPCWCWLLRSLGVIEELQLYRCWCLLPCCFMHGSCTWRYMVLMAAVSFCCDVLYVGVYVSLRTVLKGVEHTVSTVLMEERTDQL